MAVSKKKKVSINGITFNMASTIVILMTIVLILSMIKIYLSSQIYYESKSINTMQREVETLKAEKVILQQNIELLKFKYKVTDTIFDIDEDKE